MALGVSSQIQWRCNSAKALVGDANPLGTRENRGGPGFEERMATSNGRFAALLLNGEPAKLSLLRKNARVMSRVQGGTPLGTKPMIEALSTVWEPTHTFLGHRYVRVIEQKEDAAAFASSVREMKGVGRSDDPETVEGYREYKGAVADLLTVSAPADGRGSAVVDWKTVPYPLPQLESKGESVVAAVVRSTSEDLDGGAERGLISGQYSVCFGSVAYAPSETDLEIGNAKEGMLHFEVPGAGSIDTEVNMSRFVEAGQSRLFRHRSREALLRAVLRLSLPLLGVTRLPVDGENSVRGVPYEADPKSIAWQFMKLASGEPRGAMARVAAWQQSRAVAVRVLRLALAGVNSNARVVRLSPWTNGTRALEPCVEGYLMRSSMLAVDSALLSAAVASKKRRSSPPAEVRVWRFESEVLKQMKPYNFEEWRAESDDRVNQQVFVPWAG